MTRLPLITHILWGLERAGAERMVIDLCMRLPEQGYRTLILAPGGTGPMVEDLRERGLAYAVGPRGHHRRQTMAFLRTHLLRERPDVVHTHLGGDIWGGLVAWQHRLHPWIITAHNMDQDDGWLLHRARRLAFRRADHVVCVSRAVQTYVQKEFGVKEERSSCIPNGISLSACLPRGTQGFQDIPHLVTVGRLSKQKDQETLLRALALIKYPWRLSIIGEGPEDVPLRRLASSLGILPRVDFLGTIPDARTFLREADLFCFPSRWEGQGLALLEAAACAVPIVVSDLPVFHEAFDEGMVTYASPRDASAWARAIQDVLTHPAEALARAARAQAVVQERYSLDRMVESYAMLYHQQLRAYPMSRI